MSKLGTLEQIRAKFAGQQQHKETPKCEKCGFALTVEQTKFFHTEVCENCFEHAKVVDLATCCDKEDLQPVKMVTAGGGIQVRNQCKSCGYVRPNSLGGFDRNAREKLPELDTKARDRRDGLVSEMYSAFYQKRTQRQNEQAQERREQIRSNWMKDYNKYLDSSAWREKRALVLKRDGYVCQCCLNSRATQVHHKSYQFVDLKGSEPAFDLVAICSPCHEKIEAMKKLSRG